MVYFPLKSVMKYIAKDNQQALKESLEHSVAVIFRCTIQYILSKLLDHISKALNFSLSVPSPHPSMCSHKMCEWLRY